MVPAKFGTKIGNPGSAPTVFLLTLIENLTWNNRIYWRDLANARLHGMYFYGKWQFPGPTFTV